jgi:hypothetical protein
MGNRLTMKISFAIVTVLVLLLLNQSTNACDCRESPTAAASLQNGDIDFVFRGFVTRQIDIGSVDINDPKYFSVRVWKFYKGCSNLSNATSIVLKTAGTTALCGIQITLNKNYIFSARSTPSEPKVVTAAKRRIPNIYKNEMVRVENCDFNSELVHLSSTDKFLLHNHTNVCPTNK